MAPTPTARARLTSQQKKANHIASEQKRREAIRKEYDRLANIVPGTEGMGRSEALVLERTIKYMRDQVNYRYQMLSNAKRVGLDVGKYELDGKVKEGMRKCEEQDVLRLEMESGSVVGANGNGGGNGSANGNGNGAQNGDSLPE